MTGHPFDPPLTLRFFGKAERTMTSAFALSERLISSNKWRSTLIWIASGCLVGFVGAVLNAWLIDDPSLRGVSLRGATIGFVVGTAFFLAGQILRGQFYSRNMRAVLPDGDPVTVVFDREGVRTNAETDELFARWPSIRAAHIVDDHVEIDVHAMTIIAVVDPDKDELTLQDLQAYISTAIELSRIPPEPEAQP